MTQPSPGPTYLVATLKPWNVQAFEDRIRHFPGTWHLLTDPAQLTLATLQALRPRYVFFPHWSEVVPQEILDAVECVCFHETDLPQGRGGSPIQNLIARGCRETQISALRMVAQLDAGPIYLKRPLSLEGSAEEIFLRAAQIVADMIGEIARAEPVPVEQEGEPSSFRRRTPEQSRIPVEPRTLVALFDHLRMLDAQGYPKAFLDWGGFRYEFSRASLRVGAVHADVTITPLEKP